MESTADFTDTSFQMPCMRCNQLLQGGDRFCRFCGQDQLDAGIDPWASRPVPLDLVGSAPQVEHIELPLAGLDTSPLSASGLVPTDSVAGHRGRPMVPAPDGDGRAPPGADTRTYSRLLIGIGVLLLLGLAALLAHDFYRTRQEEAARRGELNAALQQVESALGRGDLAAAQLKLSILAALNPDNADVQAQRERFERRVQEMTDERDRLRAAIGPPASVPVVAPAAVAAPALATAPAVPSSAATSPVAAEPPQAAVPTPVAVQTPVAPPEPPTPQPAPVAVSALPAPAANAVSESPPPAPTPEPPAPTPADSAPEPAPADAAPSPVPTSATCHEALAAMALCPNR